LNAENVGGYTEISIRILAKSETFMSSSQVWVEGLCFLHGLLSPWMLYRVEERVVFVVVGFLPPHL
jgi:hypothetical protein